MKYLPPLKAVRAFEACYRLGSFTRAARELNVGQPAISHQIRLLEEDLGTKLFIKHGALTQPTAEADLYYRQVVQSLGDLERASIQLRRRQPDAALTIATYPGIAAFWLLPRLARMKDAASGIATRVTTAELDRDMPIDDVDCAILFGDSRIHERWPGHESRLLIPEVVLPIAAPALMRNLGQRSQARLLEQGPLIHLDDSEHRWFTWRDWQQARAPQASRIDRGMTVTNHGIAIHQALQGAGIALGWVGIIQDLLQAGTLVALSKQPLTSPRGYHLIAPRGFFATPKGRLIGEMLLPR
jgi:DNA-binding transcriptional LysR family regulator